MAFHLIFFMKNKHEATREKRVTQTDEPKIFKYFTEFDKLTQGKYLKTSADRKRWQLKNECQFFDTRVINMIY